MKKIISLITLSFLLLGCTGATLSDPKKLSIYTSFYPLAFLAEEIAGDKADVFNVVPNGMEPHDFEPSSKTIAAITDSDLFLYNGVGIDEWAVQFVATLNGKPAVLNTSEVLDIINVEGRADPHFWLDPNNMLMLANQIKMQLISIDPTNANFYEGKNLELQFNLKTLDVFFSEGLSSCETKTFVTSHSAFAYLAKRYGLEMLAISGISPDEEPSTKKIAEISSFVEEYGVKYVFAETLLSSKITETIANETGAQILVLNPIEGLTNDEEKNREDYFSIMSNNLKNLKTALSCR